MSSTLASVDNALRVLHLLRRSGPLRLSEIAQDLDVGASTAHRLVSTLRDQRFVRQESHGRRYELGPAMLFTAGTSAIEHCVTTATPIMAKLRDAIEETVHLSSLRGTEVIFLASAESNRLVRVTTRVGRHPKAHATAAGKVLLAELDDDRFEELYPGETLDAPTDFALRSRTQLRDELLRVRQLGFARNLRESEPDMYTIAVPLRRPDGSAICALAISTPHARAHPGNGSGLSSAERDSLESLRNAKELIESWLAF